MSGLYLHVPFCRRKCPYCDFFSVAAGDAPVRTYPDLLCRELELAHRAGWRGPFETVFFGGGTPSLLTPDEIARVLGAAREIFGVAPNAEISLEANPGTLSPGALERYRQGGINRLSLGVQSLDAAQLTTLGRIHSPHEVRQAVRWARRAGFDNLSCDLMFALPGEDLHALRAEIDAFLALAPEHLSCYGLTVEEETPFHHLHRAGGLPLPDEASFAEQYAALHEWLGEAGYGHYEVSNYALPGRECRHNRRYWERRSTLGVGAGAHSFYEDGWGRRSAVPSDLRAYEAAVNRGEYPALLVESFDRRGAMAETLYLGLRTAEGIEEGAFRRRFGQGVAEACPDGVRQAGERLALREGRWRLDLQGWLLYDHLITRFL